MSGAAVAIALLPAAGEILGGIIEAAIGAGDQAAVEQIGAQLDSLSARLHQVRTPATIVHEAAEARRRALRARETDPASLPPVLQGPSVGKVAFEAYSAARGGKNHDGSPTPVWEALGEGVRSGWEAAALAARSTE